MKPHARIRKTVKWAGPIAILALLALWWWSTNSYSWVHSAYEPFIGAHQGRVRIGVCEVNENWQAGWFSLRWPTHTAWWFAYNSQPSGQDISIPIWMFLVPVSLATALAWRSDILARRRDQLNLCPTCHYPLTGLAKGAACPECAKQRDVTPAASCTLPRCARTRESARRSSGAGSRSAFCWQPCAC